MVERESTETMIPPLNLKARVVVPLANLTSWPASLFPQAEAKLERQYSAGYSIVVRVVGSSKTDVVHVHGLV